MGSSWIVVGLFAGLFTGCGVEDFPGAPSGALGERDVPYVTTYNFGFEVGFSSISGVNGNLLIVSGGDLINMISAANITQAPGAGVISGRVFTTAGFAAANVVLTATDVTGRRLGDFFYNSLGGTPDFVQTRGTVTSGGFTAFNVAPGEVFLKATAGGRGAGRLTAFPDEVSLATVTVAPVVVPTIGVTGEISDETGRAVVDSALQIEVVGQRVSEAADCGDDIPTQELVEAASFSTLTAYRICVASDGEYVAKVSGDPTQFVDTYQWFRSDRSRLDDLQTTDITEFLTIQTVAGLQETARAAGPNVTWDPAKGVLVGQVRQGNGSPRSGAAIHVTDEDGNSLVGNGVDSNYGVIMYLDQSGAPVVDARELGTSRFVIFNIPIPENASSRVVYVTVRVEEFSTEGLSGKHVGTLITPVIPNGVIYHPITLATAPPPVQGEVTVPSYFTGPVSGRVMQEDGLKPVVGARITPMGVKVADWPLPLREQFVTYSEGRYDVGVGAPGDLIPLLQLSEYLVKVDGPGSDYRSTYQRLRTGSAEFVPGTTSFKPFTQDLVAVTQGAITQYLEAVRTSGVAQDGSRGLLLGTAVEKATGRPAPGISIRLSPLDGAEPSADPSPSIFYFDFAGIPRPDLRATTGDGRFIVFNAPVGSVSLDVTSRDDTGNVIVDSRADGVSVVRLPVNNAPPESVEVSGSIAALVGDVAPAALSLTVAGGDPIDMRTQCPEIMSDLGLERTFERGGVCYRAIDLAAREHSLEKTPVECTDDALYGPYRVERVKGDGFCVLEYAATASTFAVPVGSSREVVMKTTGVGLMDTYTYGIRTSDRALNNVAVGAVTSLAVDAVASAAGVSRTPETGIIWGRTTMAGLGEVDENGVVTPRTCADWTRFPDDADVNNDTVGCAGLGTPGALVRGFFNADTYLDLAVVDSASPAITVWLNTSTGSFVRSQIIARTSSPSPCQIGAPDCGVEDNPVALVVTDFTRDGLADLVSLNQDSRSISLLEGRGRGRFVFRGSLPVGDATTRPNALAAGDFNGDGAPDLLITEPSGHPMAFLGTGSGFRSLEPPVLPTVLGNGTRAVVAGDLDRDGRPDAVFVNCDTITVMLRVFGATRLTKYEVVTGTDDTFCLDSNLRSAAIGDLNFDGYSDVVVGGRMGSDTKIWVFMNSSSGLSAPTTIAADGSPAAVALVDLQSDGALDLIVLDSENGTVVYHQGDGQGGFLPQEPERVEVGGNPGFMAVGDVTGDGLVDLTLSNPLLAASRVMILPQTAVAREDVTVAAVQADGRTVGDIVYLDGQGGPVPGATATGLSGRFAVFNVPPGMVWLRMLSAGVGSRLVYAYADSVVNTAFPVIPGSRSTIDIRGATVDVVVRPVGEVQIRFLGTGHMTSSNPILFDVNGNATGGADYRTRVEANNDYVLKLTK